MKKNAFILFILIIQTFSMNAQTYKAIIKTNYGNITVVLFDETPLHRDNFIKLVKEHFYDSLLFHRVIKGFEVHGRSPDWGLRSSAGFPLYIQDILLDKPVQVRYTCAKYAQMETGMDLGVLRIFIDVARRGGFSPVARDRDLDPSSVSRTIAVLEAELGVRLFQRTTRRLTLTEAGGLYFDRIEALVDHLDAARDDALAISTGPLGTLRLTASVAFCQACLMPLLPAFRQAFPALKLELLLSDANLDWPLIVRTPEDNSCELHYCRY